MTAPPDYLQTARLILCPLEESDLPTLVREIGRWEVARFLVSVSYPYTEAHGREWLEESRALRKAGKTLNWVATLADGGPMIGSIGLQMPTDTKPAEFGYWLAPSAWGNGYATEMVRAIVRLSFETLKLASLCAHADPENAASNRVLEKAGLIFQGVDPHHDRGLRGPPRPSNIWSLSRAEWEMEGQ